MSLRSPQSISSGYNLLIDIHSWIKIGFIISNENEKMYFHKPKVYFYSIDILDINIMYKTISHVFDYNDEILWSRTQLTKCLAYFQITIFFGCVIPCYCHLNVFGILSILIWRFSSSRQCLAYLHTLTQTYFNITSCCLTIFGKMQFKHVIRNE